MINIEGHWVWDSWYVYDSGHHHAYYLKAPRSLGDPQLRHANAVVGHSVSVDLMNWTALPDALGPSVAAGFDDLAIWTGSIVRREGTWHLFYTGVDRRSHTSIQRIGHATSTDLTNWTKLTAGPVASADPRWYSTAEASPSHDEPWRDPWVFTSAQDGLWHMLVTAREPASGTGVDSVAHGSIGHCVSVDLASWAVLTPLSEHSGFRQIEVVQVLEIDGRFVVVFCAASTDVLSPGIRPITGTYSAPADSELGPFHLEHAEAIDAAGIYAGRVLERAPGDYVLLGFVDTDADGNFAGVISDPIPVQLTERGTLQPSGGAIAAAASSSGLEPHE